jgi:hypothetical protein
MAAGTMQIRKSLVAAYACLFPGIPVIYGVILLLAPDRPGTGILVYGAPIVAFAMFMGILRMTRAPNGVLHVVAGFVVSLAVAFGSIVLYGLLLVGQSGLAGTQ